MTRNGQPRYQALAQTLIERIEAGAYGLGTLLPTEQELCVEFGVSRHTVREALRRLAAQSYVRRRQGSGSEVISDRPQAGYLHRMRSLSELFEYAEDTTLVCDQVDLVVADEALAARLGRRPGRHWLRAIGQRRARSGEPICASEIYLHESFAALADEMPTVMGPLYQLIEARFAVRVAEVAQEITAGPFPAALAPAFAQAAGNPAVCMTRRYLDDTDQPLIISFNWHPAGSFAYAMRLRREDGPL